MTSASAVHSPSPDRFEVHRSLGSGGFGEVFEAWDRERETTVAVKRLRRVGQDAVHRFKREFRSLAGLSHPNLAQLFELVSDGEEWLFSMELIRGGRDFVSAVRAVAAEPSRGFPSISIAAESSPLVTDTTIEHEVPPTTGAVDVIGPEYDERKLRAALRQLARGVKALHDAGKLHRDIKPHNVLVSDEGRVVLLDFGMVRELSEDVGSTGSFVGTPHYMSPEQAMNAELGPAADWYSVGVMLYEVLVGEYPVEGRAVVQILLRKQSAQSPPDAEFPPGTPDDLRLLCQRLLENRPEDRPTGVEVLALLGDVEQADSDPGAFRDIDEKHGFVGRRAELALLGEMRLRVRRERRPMFIHVTGRSGMGKSSLVRHFLAELDDANTWILRGRCYENEWVPYKAFDGIVDQLVERLRGLDPEERDEVFAGDVAAMVRVFPAFQRIPAFSDVAEASMLSSANPDLRAEAFQALRWLVDRLTSRREIVLFIDDVQWGDRDSAELLSALFSGASAPPVFVIMTYRGGDAPGDLLPVLASADDIVGEYLELGGLGEPEARELAHQLGGGSLAVDRIVREGGGSPYFIDQLVRAADDPSHGTLEDTIEHRLAKLGEQTREFMEVVSLAGRPIDVRVVRDVVGMDAELPQALARLRNERFVRLEANGEFVAPYHDRIRETVRDRLPEARRTHAHLRLASVLERRGGSGADPEMLATHFRDGGESKRAAGYFRVAAESALGAFAYDRAARCFQEALELGSWREDEFKNILIQRGTVLAYLGRGNESSEAFVRAAPLVDSVAAIELRRRAAEQLLRAGQIERGMELLYEVLEGLDVRLPRGGFRLDASLLWSLTKNKFRGTSYQLSSESLDALDAVRVETCFTAANVLGVVDIKLGAYFQMLNFRQSLDSGNPDFIARTLALQAVHAAAREKSRDEYEPLIAEAAEVAASAEDQFVANVFVDFARGMAGYMAAEFPKAFRWFEDVMQRLASKGSRYVWELQLVQLYRIYVLFELGRLDTLAEVVGPMAQQARRRDDLLQWSAVSIWRHVERLMADDPDGASSIVANAAGSWSSSGYHIQHYWALQADVRIALYRDDAHTACRLMQEGWAEVRGGMLLTVDLPALIAFDLRARGHLLHAAQTGDTGVLRSVRKDIKRLERMPREMARCSATLLRAQVAAVEGDHDSFREGLARAEAKFAALGHESSVAAIRMRLGEALGATRGADLSRRAHAWFERQGVVDPTAFARMFVPISCNATSPDSIED